MNKNAVEDLIVEVAYLLHFSEAQMLDMAVSKLVRYRNKAVALHNKINGG